MKTIFVEIMPDGVTAKTVNPLGENSPCPRVTSCIPCRFEGMRCIGDEWQQAELERKVYEIDCWIETNGGQTMEYIPRWEPGSIHEATEINTKQIRIL